jgi:hypothetical protein
MLKRPMLALRQGEGWLHLPPIAAKVDNRGAVPPEAIRPTVLRIDIVKSQFPAGIVKKFTIPWRHPDEDAVGAGFAVFLRQEKTDARAADGPGIT